MKTEYKYIHFVYKGMPRKTQIWSCRSNSTGNQLGLIRWWGPWRQYCFFPYENTVFNKGCLEDINHFITQLMEERNGKNM